MYASLAPEIGLAATAYGSQCLSRREPVAAVAHGGQRSADASADLDRAAKRVPFATKISPAVIEVITAIRNHAVAAFQRSRGRIVAADSSAIHTRRLRKGTTRRFQEVIYVTERAGATGNEDILSVHSDVRAQAMLQAQDLVLGFARFLGGSFAGFRAAGVSTDASRDLTSTKTSGPARGRQRPRRREPQIAGRTNQTQQGKASHVAASPRSNSISDRRALALPLAREQGSLPYWRI